MGSSSHHGGCEFSCNHPLIEFLSGRCVLCQTSDLGHNTEIDSSKIGTISASINVCDMKEYVSF
jgi:hypothetical protein